MKYDVIGLGELLIDFTDYGISEQGNLVFEANPGGGPGNMLAMLAKLGKRTALISKVGNDMLGELLIEALEKSGISTECVFKEQGANTTLAFVHNKEDGEREFSFYRKPGADTLLSPDDVKDDLIKSCSIFHFGSLSLTHQPVREATQRAVALARESSRVVSFDPNLRPLLWDSLEDAHQQIDWGCSVCDILKIADDELFFLTGKESNPEGISFIREKYPQIRMLLLTKGSGGSEVFYGKHHISCPAFKNVKTIDTTGAGDTFLGCCLSHVLDFGLDNLSQRSLDKMLIFANAAASLLTTKKGALRSMPEKSEVISLTWYSD